MTIELLIQSIVRQTTILIGQLATAGGTRAPLAPVAGRVFLDLVHELERQGVSRKVSADMFGMSLRTYQRKIQRLTESSTHHGRSLWEAVLDYVQSQGVARRAQVLLDFARDDESQVRSVLHDLCESGLVTASGTGASLQYRITPEEELLALRQSRRNEGLDELLWALVYREGPLTREELGDRHFDGPSLDDALERLVLGGRVERAGDTYRASTLVVPLGSALGWEAAVFDHYQALVNTITCRLRAARTAPSLGDRVGGSTYTFEVWPGHPLEQEAYATLAGVRERLSDLRRRIEAHNADQPAVEDPTQVLFYVGQCVIAQDAPGNDEGH
jgi:hypothetical protein